MCLSLSLGVAGCSTLSQVVQAGASLIGLGPPKPAPPNWKALVISAAPDANGNSPVAVDVVFVSEAALVEAMLSIPANKWFATRRDTERSFPGGLSMISLEVVPSQNIKLNQELLERQKALAIFVFASYASPGEHRERLLPQAESYLLQLSARGFKALEVKSAAQ